MATESLRYRADLDGMRAIAVLSVIFYHLSHKFLLGGFLGVDIFFVLSGFLIASIIWREALNGEFSFRRFYERRIRRIMPALLVVLLLTTTLSIFILLPADLVGYCRSLIATMTFVANIYFWRDTDYFARAAEAKPLLHMWSLGVEEQFYIIFPFLLIALARFRLQIGLYALAGLTIASFVLNVFVNHVGGASPAFFLLPTRAWELGIGALAALLPASFRLCPRLANILAWIGFITMVTGLFAPIKLTGDTPAALSVVVGTTLVIVAGRQAGPTINRMLSWRPIVFVGLISYSLYLWHWPIIVLFNYYFVNGISVPVAALEIILMPLLALASWHFIERPFRNQNMPTYTVVLWSGSGLCMLTGIAAVILIQHGLPSRLDAKAAAINEAVDAHYRCPVSEYIQFGLGRACPMSLPSRNPADADVVLLGNSHAQMYAPAWSKIFLEQQVKGLLVPANGCLPTISANYGAECAAIAAQNLSNVLAMPNVKLVILAFTWAWPDPLTNAEGKIVLNEHNQDLVSAIDDLTARIRDKGKKVILIGPIARPGWDVPSVVSREIAFGWPIDHQTEMPIEKFDNLFRMALTHFEANRDIVFVPVSQIQCDQARCSYLIDGRSLYSDDSHISEAELWRFAGMFRTAFAAAGLE